MGFKGSHTVYNKIEKRPRTKEGSPLEIDSACETMELYWQQTVHDSKFVRWSFAFHHVLVFTV